MKIKPLLFLLGLALSLSSYAQTIRRVNNTPGVTGSNVYTTIQAAHDAAVAGDILYLEPSATGYGTLTCTKRLSIYGIGYFLNTNAVIGSVSFANGSSNSLISGVLIDGSVRFQGTVTGITMERCWVGSSVTFNSTCTGATSQFPTNCTIRQCFIYGNVSGNCTGTSNIVNNSTGISIVNSIVRGQIEYLNNCLVSNSFHHYSVYMVANSTITNSISWYGVRSGINNSVSNNICEGCSDLPSGNGNLVNQSNVFTRTGSSEWDGFFRLAIGSPAIGAGAGGGGEIAGRLVGLILMYFRAYPLFLSLQTSLVVRRVTTTPH